MAGKLITLEGGEGAGKSTQAERLATALRSRGLEVVVTREPGGTGAPFAELVRHVLLASDSPPHGPLVDVLLFYAARSDHLDTVIRPALAAGTWVVCDRFSDSTRAYQGAVGGTSLATIDAIDRLVVGPTQPDLTLLLDLPADVGLARATARRARGEADRFEAQDLAFHTRLRQAFLDLAKAKPKRFQIIDAVQPIDAVSTSILGAVTTRLLNRQA